ncbi:Hpt domain-containing protein [bacterium]|nr:Hpt domain-containing protein [bacterium]
MMHFNNDMEIISTFEVETKEHLELIELGILQLANSQEKINKDLVRAMFRSAHSIKAGSNLLELQNIGALAHALEVVLQKLLSDAFPIESESATVFLQGIDTIRELLENLQFSDLANVTSLVEKLTEQSAPLTGRANVKRQLQKAVINNPFQARFKVGIFRDSIHF